MAHSYVAYVDESGDEGFQFRDLPGKGSSQWFVLSALIIPSALELSQLRLVDTVIKPIEQARGKPIHFHKLNHEQRVAVCAAIGASDFMSINICIDKTRLTSAALKSGYALYFYATRYLIERFSWLARDALKNAPGDGTVKMIFSNRTRMSYDDLRDYVRILRAGSVFTDTKIHWPAIVPELITSRAHDQLVGLRAADALASGIRWGLELTQYGHFEDRYARLMARNVYRRNGNARSYGLKFFPGPPARYASKPDHYAWCDEIFPK